MAEASSKDMRYCIQSFPWRRLEGGGGTFVSSKHFPLRRRSPENLKTDYPSVFMTIPDYVQKSSPKKRKTNKSQQVSRCLLTNVKESGKKDDRNYDTYEEMEVDTDYSVSVAMQFEQLTRELEVKVYKGLPSTETLSFYSII